MFKKAITILIIGSTILFSQTLETEKNTNELSEDMKTVFSAFNKILEKDKKVEKDNENSKSIEQFKEEQIRTKVEKMIKENELEGKHADSEFMQASKSPIPLGYSQSGNKIYAYIDFRGKIYKLSKGQAVLGFKVNEIKKSSVSMYTPSGTLMSYNYVIPSPKNSSASGK